MEDFTQTDMTTNDNKWLTAKIEARVEGPFPLNTTGFIKYQKPP